MIHAAFRLLSQRHKSDINHTNLRFYDIHKCVFTVYSSSGLKYIHKRKYNKQGNKYGRALYKLNPVLDGRGFYSFRFLFNKINRDYGRKGSLLFTALKEEPDWYRWDGIFLTTQAQTETFIVHKSRRGVFKMAIKKFGSFERRLA